MTDKMEPVAWIDFYSATFLKTAAYRVARVTSYPDEIKKIPLYTADQVKELTERLDASDKERVDAVARNMAHIERWNKAEAALAEARKVIEPFAAVVEKDIGESEHDEDYFEPMKSKYGRAPRLRVKHMRTLSRWLQANKGDA
jgi:hypothetical protein